MGKLIEAIVRGPENYFDGQLFAPGQKVMVDSNFVSDEDYIEKETVVRLPQPVVQNGDLITEAKQKVRVRTRFLPIGSAPQAEQPTTTAEVATGDLDRLDVTDFLKQGNDQIVAAIASGKVDSHLGVIEQAELSRRGPGRKAVSEAIAARLSANRR